MICRKSRAVVGPNRWDPRLRERRIPVQHLMVRLIRVPNLWRFALKVREVREMGIREMLDFGSKNDEEYGCVERYIGEFL